MRDREAFLVLAYVSKDRLGSRRRRHKGLQSPADPLAEAKVDYAFNLLATGILQEPKYDLSRLELIKRLVGADRARPKNKRPSRESRPSNRGS